MLRLDFRGRTRTRSSSGREVDAQGSDLGILLGAGEYLDQVESATLELHEDVRTDGHRPERHRQQLKRSTFSTARADILSIVQGTLRYPDEHHPECHKRQPKRIARVYILEGMRGTNHQGDPRDQRQNRVKMERRIIAKAFLALGRRCCSRLPASAEVRYENELPCSHAVRLLAAHGLEAQGRPCASFVPGAHDEQNVHFTRPRARRT